MATLVLTRGDTRPALRYALPAGVDLTGATVRFTMEGIVSLMPAEIITTTPPVVQYNWRQADTAVTGLRKAEFAVIYPDGELETFSQTDNGRLGVLIRSEAGEGSGTVIRHIIGDVASEPITLSDDTGEPLDLTGATVTALVTVGGTVVEHPFTIHDALLGEAWPDWNALALPVGRYPMRLRVTLSGAPPDIADDLFTLEVIA